MDIEVMYKYYTDRANTHKDTEAKIKKSMLIQFKNHEVRGEHIDSSTYTTDHFVKFMNLLKTYELFEKITWASAADSSQNHPQQK